MFDQKEVRFLKANEVCRLATVSKDGTPHVVPICYIFYEGVFYMVTDYGTKKYKNIKNNDNVCLVVDVYKPNRAVMIKGKAEILERGEEFRRVSQMFFKKFLWARRDPWDEGEAPIIKVKPKDKVSWGIR